MVMARRGATVWHTMLLLCFAQQLHQLVVAGGGGACTVALTVSCAAPRAGPGPGPGPGPGGQQAWCEGCAGVHQQQLQSAGCDQAMIKRFCASSGGGGGGGGGGGEFMAASLILAPQPAAHRQQLQAWVTSSSPPGSLAGSLGPCGHGAALHCHSVGFVLIRAADFSALSPLLSLLLSPLLPPLLPPPSLSPVGVPAVLSTGTTSAKMTVQAPMARPVLQHLPALVGGGGGVPLAVRSVQLAVGETVILLTSPPHPY